MILRIQCPACERQFKVGDELMGRMVECGACENRFRFTQEVTIPNRERSYPGDIKRPGLRGAARVPMGNAGPVSFEAIEYENSATAADAIPLSPQRKVSLATGLGVLIFAVLMFVLGSEPGGLLQDIGVSKRLVIGGFLALVGAGLVVWGARRRKGGVLTAIVLGAMVLVLSASLPVHYSLDPEVANNPVKPLPGSGDNRPVVDRRPTRATTEEIMEEIGFGPVKKAWLTHTTADRDGRERVVAIWVPGMEERFKFQIQKYLQRILKTKERPSYLDRRSGGLIVIGGVDENLDYVTEVVENFGVVEDIYPEIQLITMSINGERFLGAGPELMGKLTDSSNQAFYVRNLQELSHIDIDRVKEAAQRLAGVEPLRFRKEITLRLVDLLQEESPLEYKGVFVEALAVWSEPGDGTDLAVAQAVTPAMGTGEDIPRSMIDFLITRGSAAAAPLVEALWAQDPQTWESSMVDLGDSTEEAAAQALDSNSRGLRFSAVNLLKRFGTQASVPALRAQKAQSSDEEFQRMLEEAIRDIGERGGAPAPAPPPPAGDS